MHRPTLLVFAALAPALASAAPLLERTTATGMVQEFDARLSRCTLDDGGQLTLQIRNADLQTQRAQQLQIGVAPLRRAIAAAAAGEIVSEAGPVDGPSRAYVAWRPAADGGAPQRVVLLVEDGGGGQNQTNTDPAARKLVNFLDANCGLLP